MRSSFSTHTSNETEIHYTLTCTSKRLLHTAICITHHVIPKTAQEKAHKANSYAIAQKCNCTKDDDFEKHAEDMKKHYSNRGYPEKIIQDSYCKAKARDHHSLIHGEKRKKDGDKRIPLVLTYNPLNPNLMKIVKKHWQISHLSPDCKKLFPETPILAYRRNRNLRDTLVRTSLLKPIQTEKDQKLPRNKCITPNCTWCRELKSTNSHAPQPAVRFQVQKTSIAA